MNKTSKGQVAVVFGGRSVEHEVAIITGHQAMDALESAGYSVLPVYITKDGHWYAGQALNGIKQYANRSFEPSKLNGIYRVSLGPDSGIRLLVAQVGRAGFFGRLPHFWADVFFPTVHGSHGEDGTIQGLFELADVPYVGSNVIASSIGIDKVRTKSILRAADLPVLDCLSLSRSEWESDNEGFSKRAEEAFGYPMIVKPVNLGSSIGVNKCNNQKELREAMELALLLDQSALVERALSNFIEVNCAVLGPPPETSICEQPLPREAVLTFDDKYKGGKKGISEVGSKGGMASQARIVPAPIPEELTKRIQEMSVRAFGVIGAAGVARIDFLVEDGSRPFVNEINTMPGSLAFYLWEPLGIPFDELVDRLVRIALERHSAKRATQFAFATNLLSPG